jgi:hypothetical protein
VVLLSHNYLINSPRLMYLGSVGAALLWASVVEAVWGRSSFQPLRRVAAVIIAAAILIPSSVFVRQRMDLYTLTTAPFQSIIAAADGALPADVDAIWQERVTAAKRAGQRLCYVAGYADGRVSVALQAVDALSPFYRLRGTENAVIYHSDIYHDTPLTITGPGAGIGVTGAGVFTDIIAAAESLSRRAGISALAA